ncbi:16S rRNA (cytosine(967)-C(5))-methyltransferase RsmB [Ruminococcus champanellensis]|uniref:16S rRNA (cytosine(967)-C(5))-methyltransferase RsmB n=1 Tax=Ruminococcus champanellensis TaxID=1161942 RepID=UPI002E7AA3A3|nr:16S rRNA (cytosine(967)-C(5))-methyltransferase RsmB [Ruminococcus champanellensis]MED9891568.1 16S rRNA (cytosine(967)-C(5))-methyltransferase RsmB [Ruminococcus champanellensis]
MGAELVFCVRLLDKTFGAQGYSNIALDRALRDSELNPQQKSRVSALYYGVIERLPELDYVLSRYSKKPPEKLDPTVRNLLRCGVYQLAHMRIPDNAAVNECVNACKKLRYTSASGFVNAVLRGFVRDGKQIPVPKDPALRRQVQYCAPDWLIKQLSSEYGESVMDALLTDALGRPPVTLRRNPLAGDASAFLRAMGDISVEKHPLLSDCYRVQGGDVTRTDAFAQGMFHVQDLASQLCCLALDPQPGDTVLDLCAAPGGKSFTLAELMEDRGQLYAFDLHTNRVKLIAQGAQRLHLQCVHAQTGDASIHNPELPQADRVLCDVPCSGLGVIRRKPEIKYKDPAAFAGLPPVQAKILENAARYVKPGGYLVYSTCTLSRAENDGVVDGFLQQHPEFEGVSFLETLGEPFGNWKVPLHPGCFGSDGFFMAKLKRAR